MPSWLTELASRRLEGLAHQGELWSATHFDNPTVPRGLILGQAERELLPELEGGVLAVGGFVEFKHVWWTLSAA
jgi:hypothetical protein